MAKKRRDRLGVTGVASALLKHFAQQRSMERAREKKDARANPVPKVKKPRDTRTPEEIRRSVDSTRARLVATVGGIKYDLDLPARARDLRDRIAASVPKEWRGEPRATIVAASVLVTGLGSIVLATVARLRTRR